MATMKETILQLHEEMNQTLDRLGSEPAGTVHTEQCYQAVEQYWKLAKQEVRQTGFPDAAAEIDFFKQLKAKFTGPLEYCLLLYRYQLYADAGSAELQQFRQVETDRIRRFRETHASFIYYCERVRTEWDDLYFLRRKLNCVQRPKSQVYDRATDFWTNGDWIVTLLQGNRLFEQFLEINPPPA
jgi:hypothetical protein